MAQEQMTTAPPRQEQRLRMSYEQFLEQVDESAHAEWVDGEVTIFMPPNDKHQEIIGFLHTLLSVFADLFHLGIVRIAPFEMRLEALNSSREPDLLFVATEHSDRLTAERLLGPADLVIEVVSPSSLHRDRTDKFFAYQQAGVREYWLIDPRPQARRVDGYTLSTAGQYQPIVPDEQGRYASVVLPGFWLAAGWLWQEPLPNPLHALQQLSPEVKQAFRQSLDSE